MKKSTLLLFLAIIAVSFVFIDKLFLKKDNNTQYVNVYTSRKEHLIKGVFDAFYNETGIKVRYIIDDPRKLITRIKSEGKNSEADILLTTDVVNLKLAENEGILAVTDSEKLSDIIPENFRSKSWFAFTKRVRIFFYNKLKIEEDLISNYKNLSDIYLKDKLLISSSNSPYNQSLLAYIITCYGEDFAKNWVKGIVNNMARKPYGGDTAQIESVLSGEGDLAVVNTYYLARKLSKIIYDSSIPENKDELIKDFKSNYGVVFPDQNGSGAMVNVTGGGIMKFSKNKENALKLLEFMVTPLAQDIYTNGNYEYPILNNIAISNELRLVEEIALSNDNQATELKKAQNSLEDIEKHLSLAVKIADEENWR